MAIKVFDKAKWHIDNGEGRYEVLAKFHEVLSFLKKHNMLSADGLEMYELGVDTSFSLHEKMLTPEGIDFLNNYYDDVINCSARTIAKELERRLDKGGKKFYKNESVVLTESDADAFLESVGVELFEDSIGIDGTLYEGAYGESILEANGIYLYEDGIVLEGQQAEEYKARKAKEKADVKKAEDDRWDARYAGRKGEYVGQKFRQSYNPNSKDIRIRNRKYWDTANINDPDNTKEYERTIGDDTRRYKASWGASNQMVRTGKIPPFTRNEKVIADTANRHMRRHPKQYSESSIFFDIEII